ncbi:phasin family protein [Halomonas urumqiensis]|nr:phasin family protein [Halomonas urumqiensis]GHE20276.1 hypothetical protein GCM10017767_07970 [Halomonas urumqiensis]
MSAEKTKTDINQATERTTEQFDNAVAEPVRAYGALTTDYFEQLFEAQFDAVRSFTDNSLAQSRSWLEVKDADSFRQVVEEQQNLIRDMSERLKEDADKIRSLSEEYLKSTQQLTAGNVQAGQEKLKENMQKSQAKMESNLKKSKEGADEISKQSQQQSDKSKKSNH